MYQTDKNLTNFSYKNIEKISTKRVILRASLDVATDDEGRMVELARFYEALPLIKELSKIAKSVVVTAHLGRPETKQKRFSLWNIAENLRNELEEQQVKVELIEHLTLENIQRIQENDNSGETNTIFLLENIRFFPGEESKNAEERMNFAKTLASLADVFINDAFAAYRESASTYDIATLLPSYLGPVFLKEVQSLTQLTNPKRPFTALLGGSKLSEKLDALNALGEIADYILVGGAMAYTLMKAKGINVGKSLVENDKLDVAKEAILKYGDKIILPSDHMIASEFEKMAAYGYTIGVEIPDDKVAIDIGWKTIDEYSNILRESLSILWNGPMGVFEWDHSSIGTLEIGKVIENNNRAFKLAGGGDSIAAINKLGLVGFDHISTGGGAMLSILAYDKFPTLDVIINKE